MIKNTKIKNHYNPLKIFYMSLIKEIVLIHNIVTKDWSHLFIGLKAICKEVIFPLNSTFHHAYLYKFGFFFSNSRIYKFQFP